MKFGYPYDTIIEILQAIFWPLMWRVAWACCCDRKGEA